MKGDFGRTTFDAAKHYDQVLLQQGRVLLDADFNEEGAIQGYRLESTAADVIGPSGAPYENAGFALVAPAKIGPVVEKALLPFKFGDWDFLITAGHYYVDGILVENDAPVPYSKQPHWPNATLPDKDGVYLAYLDVWKRHVTALDDESLREIALGGPDTATRSQVVWQVRLTPADTTVCKAPVAGWEQLIAPSTARLAAKAEAAPDTEKVCVVPPAGGYRRLENQLYRVEIHDTGDPLSGATDFKKIRFKWSRENGSVTAWGQFQDDVTLQLTQPGRDAVRGFSNGDWIEILTAGQELNSLPGVMVRILKIVDGVAQLDPLTATPAPPKAADYGARVKVRRWESGPRLLSEQAAGDDSFLMLEDGVMVRFEPKRLYRNGDYWEIPARTQAGDVLWPVVSSAGTTKPAMLAAKGVRHHFSRLGFVTFLGGKVNGDPVDCRPLFPPLTALTVMRYVGGDGQETAFDPANPAGLNPLVQPLQVAVTNGSYPVPGALVRFAVTRGTGQVNGQPSAVVAAGAGGVAGVSWSIRGNEDDPEVTVWLQGVNPANGAAVDVEPPVRFHANLSKAAAVTYVPDPACEALKDTKTVQQALEILCKRKPGGGCAVTVGPEGQFTDLQQAWNEIIITQGRTSLCACLLPGQQEYPDGLKFILATARAPVSVHVHGCGAASRLLLSNPGLVADGLKELVFEDVVAACTGLEASVQIRAVDEVRLVDCEIAGNLTSAPLVRADAKSRLQIVRSRVLNQYEQTGEGFGFIAITQPTFAVSDRADTRTGAATWPAQRERIVASLVARNLEERRAQAALLRERAGAEAAPQARAAARKLADELDKTAVVNEEVGAALDAWRDAVLASVPRALAIAGSQADVLLEDCRFQGAVVLYGESPLWTNPADIRRWSPVLIKLLQAQPSTRRCVLRGNRFDWMTMGAESLGLGTANMPTRLPVLFEGLAADGNRFLFGYNVFMARVNMFQCNQFGRGAPVGYSASVYATLTGNCADFRSDSDTFLVLADFPATNDIATIRNINVMFIDKV